LRGSKKIGRLGKRNRPFTVLPTRSLILREGGHLGCKLLTTKKNNIMITKMTKSTFLNEWPESRKNQFSRDALCALFEYYDELSEDLGEEIEYDPIAICCEWGEYDSALEAGREYEPEGWQSMTEEDGNESALNYLRERTQIIELDGGSVLIVNY